jgi:hypothetical protein
MWSGGAQVPRGHQIADLPTLHLERSLVFACRLSLVACRLSLVACRLSRVACRLSLVACRLSLVASRGFRGAGGTRVHRASNSLPTNPAELLRLIRSRRSVSTHGPRTFEWSFPVFGTPTVAVEVAGRSPRCPLPIHPISADLALDRDANSMMSATHR